MAQETGTSDTVNSIKGLTLNEYFIRLSMIKDKIDAEARKHNSDGN